MRSSLLLLSQLLVCLLPMLFQKRGFRKTASASLKIALLKIHVVTSKLG
jgi:hypothetical protein